jgi:hypothetical protein
MSYKHRQYKVGTLLFDDIDNEFGIITDVTLPYVIEWQQSGAAATTQYQFDDWIKTGRLEICDIPEDK